MRTGDPTRGFRSNTRFRPAAKERDFSPRRNYKTRLLVKRDEPLRASNTVAAGGGCVSSTDESSNRARLAQRENAPFVARKAVYKMTRESHPDYFSSRRAREQLRATLFSLSPERRCRCAARTRNGREHRRRERSLSARSRLEIFATPDGSVALKSVFEKLLLK